MENKTSIASRWAYEIKSGQQRQCVFLAEGTQYDVKLLRGVLESDGWQTSLADKACTADNVNETAPDLVILDSMLPGIDILKICRDIRMKSRVPVLVFGKQPDKETLVACLDSGADDFITMPLNPAELLARVRALTRLSLAAGN